MDISPMGNAPRLAVNNEPLKAAEPTKTIAYGIGQQPLVELSPQGKILQQTEQAQNARAASIGAEKNQQETDNAQGTSDYVRVSSSVGTAQKNNLSAEQATEVYRSIEKLIT